jgi:hypothetical protein
MLLGSAVKFSHNDNPSGRHVTCCWESAGKFSHYDNPSGGRHVTCCWEVL